MLRQRTISRTLKALTIAMVFALPSGVLADANSKPGEGKSIKMARATWDTGWFQAYVYKQLFEELGYSVPRMISLKNPAFYTSVARGDVDLWVNGWFPVHNTYKDSFEGKASRVGYVIKGGGLQGYLVSKEHQEKYDITSVMDFKREEVKKAFDQDDDGKAEFVGCPPGWGCEETIAHHMDAYDLRDHVDVVKADYSPAMADVLARYKNGEPVFFYTWTPNWTVGLLEPGNDVMWITVPRSDFPKDREEFEDDTTVTGLDACVKDPCNLGWVAADIRPVANNKFLENNPAIETLLQKASIPKKDVYAQNAKMQEGGEDSAEDLKRHASEWIESNRDEVDAWLEAARKAAM